MVHNGIIRDAKNQLTKYFDESFKMSDKYTKRTLSGVLTQLYSKYKEGLTNGVSNGRSDNAFNKGPAALKRLFKFAKYLTNPANINNLDSNKVIYTDLILKMDRGEYDEVIQGFDLEFSDEDWTKADDFFLHHPSETFCGSKNGMMYSYIKAEGEIFRRGESLGSGGYGGTKSGDKKSENITPSAIKRQTKRPYNYLTDLEKTAFASNFLDIREQAIQNELALNPNSTALLNEKTRIQTLRTPPLKCDAILAEYYWLPSINKEADINRDLGVATSALVIRRDAQGDIYKVYQNMRYLGPSIEHVIEKNQSNDDDRLDYAIDLLLKVIDLHSGKAAQSGKPYAHGDIKPDNILVDHDGVLHLIDFGLTKDNELTTPHSATSGTKRYQAISFDLSNLAAAINDYETKPVLETPTYFFDDKLAALRTIHHQLYKTGIITEADFNRLPAYISTILDTSNIQTCIDNNDKYTLTYISSVLILYRIDKLLCTEERIHALADDESAQTRLIENYQQAKSTRASDEDSARNSVDPGTGITTSQDLPANNVTSNTDKRSTVKIQDDGTLHSSTSTIKQAITNARNIDKLLALKEAIDRTIFILHGGFGTETNDGKVMPAGAAKIYNVVMDALADQNSDYIGVITTIHDALNDKTRPKFGVFGFGARDAGTISLYQKLKNFVCKERDQDISQQRTMK